MRINKNRLFLCISIGLVVALFIAGVFFRRNLRNNHKLTNGTIVGYYWAGKGTRKYITKITFLANNKLNYTSCQLPCPDLDGDSIKAKLIGLKVPVIYNPQHPIINTPLLDRKLFNKYNIPFPDSLAWLSSYINCEPLSAWGLRNGSETPRQILVPNVLLAGP